jgi:hypothetical protein
MVSQFVRPQKQDSSGRTERTGGIEYHPGDAPNSKSKIRIPSSVSPKHHRYCLLITDPLFTDARLIFIAARSNQVHLRSDGGRFPKLRVPPKEGEKDVALKYTFRPAIQPPFLALVYYEVAIAPEAKLCSAATQASPGRALELRAKNFAQKPCSTTCWKPSADAGWRK